MFEIIWKHLLGLFHPTCTSLVSPRNISTVSTSPEWVLTLNINDFSILLEIVQNKVDHPFSIARFWACSQEGNKENLFHDFQVFHYVSEASCLFLIIDLFLKTWGSPNNAQRHDPTLFSLHCKLFCLWGRAVTNEMENVCYLNMLHLTGILCVQQSACANEILRVLSCTLDPTSLNGLGLLAKITLCQDVVESCALSSYPSSPSAISSSSCSLGRRIRASSKDEKCIQKWMGSGLISLSGLVDLTALPRCARLIEVVLDDK